MLLQAYSLGEEEGTAQNAVASVEQITQSPGPEHYQLQDPSNHEPN